MALTFLVLSRFKVCREKPNWYTIPENLNLYECLSQSRNTMVFSVDYWKPTQPHHMVLVDVGGFTYCQAHSQSLSKCFCIAAAPRFHQGDHIRLLLLNDVSNNWNTIFASSQNVVTENA